MVYYFFVNFQTAIEICIKKKYADFSGRASRSEFWFFYLFILIGSILTIIADVNMFSQKLAWKKAQVIDDIPASYKEGSLFVSLDNQMIWS